ncbi:TetR/AcrR family transcriptional regulator [Bradyrhizobium australafricanum]|uniref:TetR/AcrR family transcriptional regulator n=1 Tax=Bradyrhizobium australafricanum TaxID=2821406 RepID=UPI001CE350AB|nr:TetR/AcrR family transcriptional regulator [Bradyrhizobium australafricanum]MCA6098399.1 TetR/AcrR family transcriptional regulator [Bradyrhizobium australafricanum]
MSGKPQFDERAVISAAAGVFWRHGYAAASISDLTAATGLSRSSIYQRFGDKEGLFLEALQAHTERSLLRMHAVQANSPRERLMAILRAFLPDPLVPDRPHGCLIARSCNEAAELSAAGHAAAVAAAGRQRGVIIGILRGGISAGELAQDADVDALSWYYFGVLHAVVNFPNVGADRSVLDRMIEVALTAWPECGASA